MSADGHRRDQSGGDVVECFDRRLGLIRVERLQQRGDVGGGAAIDQVADAEIGLAQARLAQQPVLQRIDVEGVPGDIGVLLLPPGRGEIAGNAGGEAELMHAMAQHVQRV